MCYYQTQNQKRFNDVWFVTQIKSVGTPPIRIAGVK